MNDTLELQAAAPQVLETIRGSRAYADLLERIGNELAEGLAAVDVSTVAYLLERLDDVVTALSERVSEIGTHLADTGLVESQVDLDDAACDLSNASGRLLECVTEIDPTGTRYDDVIL